MIRRISMRVAFLFLILASVAVAAHAATYVGSKKSNKYHYPSCVWAQRIKPANLVVFDSAKDARAAGYVPCKVCNPPFAD